MGAWYDDQKRVMYVAEYKDAKSIDNDAKKAGAKGWTITSTAGEDGKVRVMGTLAKGIATGGIGLLAFGRSKSKGKILVTWQRVPEAPPTVVPTPTPAAVPDTTAKLEAPPERETSVGPGGVTLHAIRVAGASAYQEAIKKAAGGRARESQAIPCRAELRREPSNEHDPNAVQVLVNGRVVGYLPAETAQAWSPALASFGKQFITEAEIRGGWATNQHNQGLFGVRVFLPDLV